MYGFVRIPDEWVDNPGSLTFLDRERLLEDWRSQLLRGMDGVRPHHPVMRAFCDVCREVGMPLEEPLLFLDAMIRDLTVSRYETYDDLQTYMRGSASAVGSMMCRVMGMKLEPDTVHAAHALGEAMQLTNFLRDVGEDARRGRIYLPQEDLELFHVDEDHLLHGVVSNPFMELMRFEIGRARELYSVADHGMRAIHPRCRPAVRLARHLYEGILYKIERNGYDVFSERLRTTRADKLRSLARALAGR